MTRFLLACGVLSPALYALSDLVAGLRWEGYSFRDQTISELNAFGSPSRRITIAFGFALYLALIAFGVGAWRASEGKRGRRLAGALMVALGLFSLVAVPLASMNLRGVEQERAGTLHVLSGAVAVPILMGSMAAAASNAGGHFRLYTVVTVAVSLAFGGWSAADGGRVAEGLDTPWVGVRERTSVYAYQLWIAVFALALLREHVASPSLAGGAARPEAPFASSR